MRLRSTSLFFASATLLTAAAAARADLIIGPTYVQSLGNTLTNPSWVIQGASGAGTVGKGTSNFGYGENRAVFGFALEPLNGVPLTTTSSIHFQPYVYSTPTIIGNVPVVMSLYGYHSGSSPQASYAIPTGSLLATSLPVTTLGYLDFDVTSFVKSAYAQNWTYVGFLLLPNTSDGVASMNGGYAANTPITQLLVTGIPEPTSLSILALGAAALLTRHRPR